MKNIASAIEAFVMVTALLFAALGARHHLLLANASLAGTNIILDSVKDTAALLNDFSKQVSLQTQLDSLKNINARMLQIEGSLVSTKTTLPDVLEAERTTLYKLQKQNVSLARLNRTLEPLSLHLSEGVTETQKLQSSMGQLTGTLKKLSAMLSEMSTTMDEFYKVVP